MRGMALGKQKRERQPTMWVTTTDFPTAGSHPFYTRLNQLLRDHEFDDFAEAQCATSVRSASAARSIFKRSIFMDPLPSFDAGRPGLR
jgi:hypothetical protein